jgi:nitrogen-specific signal transduction histidine kinase
MASQSTHDLLFALCHEMGNLIGAIRLQAHLLDAEMSPKDLAIASVELDDLSARVSALLAHVRPLTSEQPRRVADLRVADLLAGVAHSLEEVGTHGVALEVDIGEGVPDVRADRDVLHHLLVSFSYFGVEAVRPRGSVRLTARCEDDRIALVVEDDGRVEEDPAGWAEQSMRGRPLLCAIASDVLGKIGGEIEAARDGDWTRVALWLPLA